MRSFELTVSDGWLLAMLAPVMFYLAFWVYRSEIRGFGLWLLGLRVLALGLVLLLLLEPLVAFSIQTQRKPLVAVLIDNSESMQLAHGEGTRSERVQALLDEGVFRDLKARARVAFFRFSEALHPLSRDFPLTWDGPATDLAGALDALRKQTAGEGLAGAVLLSDGGHNLGGRPQRAAAELGAPVFAVGVGDLDPPKDAAIVSATMDPLGYVGSPLSLEVRVRAMGLDGATTLLRVQVDGREAASRPVALHDGEQTLELEWIPERPGRFVAEVAIPPQQGERILENNRALVSTEILESRVSVLLLAGSPCPDLGYLRRVLSGDPNMEVQVVVRTLPSGWGAALQGALRDLETRDVVVLLNVPQADLAGLPERQLVSFVENGGALLAIGGEKAFEARYALSPLAQVLPFQFENTGSSFHEASFAVVFPDAEPRHPVMRFSEDPLKDREDWSALPPLLSYNRVLGAADGAEVLLHHPTERSHGRPMPLAAVKQAGPGKTMGVAFHTFWRYGLPMWGMGKTDDLSQAFWKNAVRWLVSPADVSRVRVSVDRTEYRSGEPVSASVQVLDPLLLPRPGARVTAVIPDSAGYREVPFRDLGDGRYAGVLGGFPQGDHAFRVRAALPEGGVEEGEGRFTVGRYSLEMETERQNAELLGEMAARSGGRFLGPEELGAALADLELAPEAVVVHRRFRLWGQRWPLVGLVGLLALEWTARRRRGMI